VQGNTVIDNERVSLGNQAIESTAIYQIENGKIQKVYFLQ